VERQEHHPATNLFNLSHPPFRPKIPNHNIPPGRSQNISHSPLRKPTLLNPVETIRRQSFQQVLLFGEGGDPCPGGGASMGV